MLENEELWYSYLTFRFNIAAPPSFLPPSLSENNDGTSTAFEGCFNSSHCYSLGGVSGQVGTFPQLLEQLSVEGGCFCLSCYLSPEWKVTFKHTPLQTHTGTHTTEKDWQKQELDYAAQGYFWKGRL